METVALIVGALGAGAAEGLKETTSTAVKDAYTRLRDLVRSRVTGHHQAEAALEGYSEDPDTWQQPLVKSLEATGVVDDPAVLGAAQKLMSLLGETGTMGGRYAIQVNDSSGVQVNHSGGNNQTNNFNS